jgi:predicted alternative tryptophan synthase beta-subunit
MNKKIVLRDDQMPLQWYNVVPDLPGGLQPPLDPETKEPMGPEKLAAIFPMGLLEQEMTSERFVDIPEEVLEILKIWRPSPLVRANNLEKALNTKAKIYFKNEGVSLQFPGRHQENRHRNRCRSMGLSIGFGHQQVWSGMQGLHGESLIRAETVP